MPRSLRTKSVETLSPAHGDPSRTTPVTSSATALLSTMMGGGMLTIPFAYSQVGLLGGLILQLASAVAGGFSLYILIAAARRTGAARYGDVAEYAFGPRARLAVSFLTLSLTLMCIVAYSSLLKDMLGTFLELAGIVHEGKRALLLGLLGVVAFPISLNRSLGGLSFVTPLSLASMVTLMLAVLLRGSSHAYTNWDELYWRLWPESSANVFRALPIFVLAYMAHFNALEMHSELVDPTRARLKRVIVITIAVSTSTYLLFGVAGYLWAGDGVQGDILNTFEAADPFIFVGRLGLSLAMLGNIPLMVLPARQIIVELLDGALQTRRLQQQFRQQQQQQQQQQQGAGVVVELGGSETKAKNTETTPIKNRKIEHVVYMPIDLTVSGPLLLSEPAHALLTLGIVLSAGFLSVFAPGVEVVW